MAQAVVLVAALVMLSLVYPVIRFGFGEEFIPAVTAAYILIPAMALRGLAHTLDSVLRARNLTWPGAVANLLGLICVIGLAVWWVPTGGIRSFTLALLCAQILVLTVLVLSEDSLLGIPVSELWGLRPITLITLSKQLLDLVKLIFNFNHALSHFTSPNKQV